MIWLMSLIGLPLATSPLVYIAGHHHSRRIRLFNPYRVALVLLALLWLLLAVAAQASAAGDAATYTTGTITLRLDGLSIFMTALALGLATAIVLFSAPVMAGEAGEEKYYAMVLILTGTMIGLVCAGDLFNLWVWFEGMAISSYLLVAFYRNRVDALGACVKYFIQTVSGSILVLFAIALVLLQTGTLDLAAMTAEPSPLMVVAGALFVMGFGVKVALFPNYTWLPDTYAEAPTGISAYLSGVVTVTGLIALLKALTVIAWSVTAWGALLIIIGTINIVIGNLLALPQQQVKRILAYSSISHIGYIVLAIGIGITTQSLPGMTGATLHLFIHGLMKALAFLVIGAFAFALIRQRDDAIPLTISDLKGAAARYPLMAVALVVALLSLAGIPLLAGFISKFQILAAGVLSENRWIIAITIFAALNSVLSLAYYLPIINALYSPAEDDRWQQTPTLPYSIRLPIIVLMVLLVVFGILPGLLTGLVEPASMTLLHWFGGG